jgi:hypothetical protein
MNVSRKRRLGGGAHAALCSVWWVSLLASLAASLLASLVAGCVPAVPPADQPDSVERRPPVLDGLEDVHIILPENQTLSWGKQESLELVVSGEWESYQWYIDGKEQDEQGRCLTLRAFDGNVPEPVVGKHIVVVMVTDQKNKVWTKQITFWVDR